MTTRAVIQHNTTSNSWVVLQHGAIAFQFQFESFNQGLIPTLSMFGYKLWYGYFQRDVFLHKFPGPRTTGQDNRVIRAILLLQDPGFDKLNVDEKNRIELIATAAQQTETAFIRYLTNLSLTEDWKMPALINRNKIKSMTVVTGNTRRFATNMTRADPWTHYPVLLLDHDANDINDILADPIHCHNDEILHKVFGKEMNDSVNSWSPEIGINIKVTYDCNNIKCELTGIHDGNDYNKYQGNGKELLDSHVAWRKKMGWRPKLHIHANQPKNLKNKDRLWDISIVPLAVDEYFLKECAKRPAWLEKLVRGYHDNPTCDSNTVVLWVLDDRNIDLSDLAWWCDNDANVFIDVDWKFILYIPGESYNSKFISVSQAK